jgi:predicted nucleotidyltransferase
MAVRAIDAVRNLRQRLEGARPAADLEAARRVRSALPSVIARLSIAGVKRAWLFGSLSSGLFHVGSDVDIAVEGILPWRILVLEEQLTEVLGFRVDLVPLEASQSRFREMVLRTGEQIL